MGWLFDVGRFEPIGDPVQVVPDVEIIGTVTEVYEIYRVQNVFEYENMIRGTEAANNDREKYLQRAALSKDDKGR